MRTLLIGMAALVAAGTIFPVATASAETVVIKERHHDRGMHRGDWRRHHAKVVVVKKRGHHYGWDRHHHRRHHD